MIAVAADYVAGVIQEQLRILDLDLEVLGRFPEIIEYQQAIFVRQVVENLLGVLTEPVADDVEMRGLVQPEVRFEPLACAALEQVVGTPAAAACRDRNAVDPDREVRCQRRRVDVAHGARGLARQRQGFRPAVRRAFDRFVTHVDELLVAFAAGRRIDLDAAQLAAVIKQRQLIGDFPNAEADHP